MKNARVAVAVVCAIAAAVTAVASGGAGNEPGFDTAKPPYLVPIAPGVVIDPILSTGDIVGQYQMSGIPDGLGAYRDGDVMHVLMNHETGKTFPGQPVGVDTRISKVTIDRKTRTVLSASYPFTGLEGFERFCSATLEEINGTPYFFTGEEAINAGHDGSSIVMNAETGQWTETPHFGHLNHENVTPALRLSKFVVVTTDDDFRPGQPAYLYAYIADSFEAAVSGDPARGSLYVWRALDAAKTNLTKDETIPGRFVPITQAENANSTTLKLAAAAKRAFRFARLEDIAKAQQKPGRMYFADTGKVGETSIRGRIYQFDIDPRDPTRADLTLLLDGDRGDDIYNPDNLDASSLSLMIQEDRESAFRDPPFSGGYGRVLKYDLTDRTLVPVARVNTPPPLRPGTWESSGIIDAQTLLGQGWWLLDVQAHSTLAPQPGVTLVPNTGFGEDGQLLAMYVPHS